MYECIFLIGMHDTSNTINRVINLWASLVSHTHQLVAILAVLFKSSLELLYIIGLQWLSNNELLLHDTQ